MNANGTEDITVLLACRRAEELSSLHQIYTQHGILQVVGIAQNADEVLRKVVEKHPDVLLLDGTASEFDAQNTTMGVCASAFSTGVVLLGGDDSPDFLRRAMRAGAKECLAEDADVEEIASALAEVAVIQRQIAPQEKAAPSEDHGPCRVIAVVGGKEGVGKTTMAVNLSVSLARITGDRVGLVDLAFGDAAVMLNLSTQHGFGEVAAEQGRLEPAAVRELIRQHEAGVAVIPRLARLRYLEQEPVDPYQVQDVLDALRDTYRYIVLDNPPLRLESELQILSLADDVLCVTTPWDILTLRNTRAFLDAAVGTFCPAERVRLILNRSDDKAMISRADVERALQRPVSSYVPNDARLVATSINVGVPFTISKPESPVARAVRALAGELIGQEAGHKEAQPKHRFAFFHG